MKHLALYIRYCLGFILLTMLFHGFDARAGEADTTQQRFSISVMLEPALSYRVLSDAGNSQFGPLVKQLRDEKESTLFAYSAGIYAGYRFFHSLYVESGIQYSKRGYHSPYQDLSFANDIDLHYGFVYYDPILSDCDYIYTFVGFPLQVRYLPEQKRFSITGHFGATLDYLLHSSARNNETGQEIADHGEFDSPGITLHAGAGLAYKAGPRIFLLFEPSFQYCVKAIQSFWTDEHLWSAGINLTCFHSFR